MRGGPSQRRGGLRAARPAAPLLAFLLVAPLCITGLPPGVAQGDDGDWTLDLAELPRPFNETSGLTVLALSADGHVLVVGLQSGGVLFLNATTGELVDAWEASADHGAVAAISLAQDGQRAALVFQDGFVAVLDTGQTEPLLLLYDGAGAPAEARPRVSATLSRAGDYLVTTGTEVALHRAMAEDDEVRFVEVASSPQTLGPFVYIAPDYPGFGVLAADGRVAIYAYNQAGMSMVGSQDVSMTADGNVVAIAVAGAGERFAVAFEAGRVARYAPIVSLDGTDCENGANACLRPDYDGRITGTPRGLHLDGSGLRLVAWSEREAVWIEGCTRNIDTCGGMDAAAATVQLRPPIGTTGTTLHSLDASADLGRLLVRFGGPGAATRLYNMPLLDSFQVDQDEAVDGPVRLDATGTRLFQASGLVLGSVRVTAADLAPPGGNEAGSSGPLFGLSREVLIGAGIGLGALVLLVALIPLVFAARRRPAPRPLAALDPMAQDRADFAPLPAMGGSRTAPGRIRTVSPSAPPAAPPPTGLLVLQDLAVPDAAAPLQDLDLTVRRPGVLRLHGPAPELRTLRRGLAGIQPSTGVVAAGGASQRETPLLFARRLQDGLGPPIDPRHAPMRVFADAGASHGLPGRVVARRIERDLAWLGERRGAPFGSLPAFDQWKVRLALSLLHRPHVVVLGTDDLPSASLVRPDAVGPVLRGVARHYDTLVVLLDDNATGGATWRAWADQEARLTPAGFTDRHLLQEGRPVGPPPDETPEAARPGRAGRGLRTRSSRGPHP